MLNARLMQIPEISYKFKKFHYHNRYPGGLKTFPVKNMMDTNPCLVLRRAVYGMLPRMNTRGRLMNRLFVFQGEASNVAENALRCDTPELYHERLRIEAQERLYWKALGFDPDSIYVDPYGKVFVKNQDGKADSPLKLENTSNSSSSSSKEGSMISKLDLKRMLKSYTINLDKQ